MPTSEKFFTIGEVALELGLPRWKLAYWIERGDITGPAVTVPGRRLFSSEQVAVIRGELAARERRAAPTSGRAAATQ